LRMLACKGPFRIAGKSVNTSKRIPVFVALA
jgi:hypothetical protein